jgi:sec-independent protein translocase protein TatA
MCIYYFSGSINMGFENVLLVVILIGVLLFGANKLPELARSLGNAQSEFEKARSESARESGDTIGEDHITKLREVASKLGIMNASRFSEDDLRKLITDYLKHKD